MSPPVALIAGESLVRRIRQIDNPSVSSTIGRYRPRRKRADQPQSMWISPYKSLKNPNQITRETRRFFHGWYVAIGYLIYFFEEGYSYLPRNLSIFFSVCERHCPTAIRDADRQLSHLDGNRLRSLDLLSLEGTIHLFIGYYFQLVATD